MEFFDAPVLCQRCGGAGTIAHGTTLCPACRGEGTTTERRPIPMEDCPDCYGRGYVVETVELESGHYEHRTDPCTNCEKGKGK